MFKWLLMLLASVFAGPALAQDVDAGLVNMVSGAVTYVASNGAPGQAVQAFMRLREGDRITVPPGGLVRVVYLESSRQERWLGPASFHIARKGGDPVSGKPAEVTNLPVGVPKRLAQVPELLQIAKIANLGGIQVRGGPARERKPSLEQQIAIGDARAMYEKLRRNSAADDIAPELYLYAVLNEYQVYGEMKPVVDEMLRKQPRNEDVQVLAEWVRARASR